MKIILFACCWSVLVISSVAQPPEIRGKALLVGVNHYRDPDVPGTPGCVEDAQQTAAFIQSKYGFPASSIKLLLNEQATAANIQKTFREWLIEGTKPGERVFFLYSGHGSQLPDDNHDEADGLDETIAPFDVELKTGANQIRDDRFEEFTMQLSGRLVVMIFDSCHSGTISRSLNTIGANKKNAGARYLPRPDQVAEWLQTKGGARDVNSGFTIEGNKNSQDNQPFIDKTKTGNLAGIVVISAANSKQVAFPVQVNNAYRGALSYVFVEAQRGDIPTVQQLQSRLKAQIDLLHQSGKLDGDQQPQVEIISNVPLAEKAIFALTDKTQATTISTALANPRSKIKLALRTHQQKNSYRIGETISYDITSDAAGYLYLLVFSEGGVATCLFPNEQDPANQIAAGTFTFPRAGYEFPIQEPVGRDVVVALVAKEKLNLGEKIDYRWDEVFNRLNLNRFSEFIKTRDLNLETPPAAITEWQAATIIVTTVK